MDRKEFFKPTIVKIGFVLLILAWFQIGVFSISIYNKESYSGQFPLTYEYMTNETMQFQGENFAPVFSFVPISFVVDVVFWYVIACILSFVVHLARKKIRH